MVVSVISGSLSMITYELFQEIIDSYDNWTLCQIQYNYMDEEFQAGTRGLEYAHKKGLAVVVMEPIKGGRLTIPPEKVAKIWANAPVKRTPSEWALRWVWNHPEVTFVLSGMSTMEQVIENVATAEHSQPYNLTADELALIGRVRDAYRLTESNLLHRLQVLHALSQRCGHPPCLRITTMKR